MTVDPRYSVYLSIALAIMAYISGASATLADTGMDPHTIKHMLAWITLLLGIGNSVNAVLAMIPSGPNADKSFWLGPKKP